MSRSARAQQIQRPARIENLRDLRDFVERVCRESGVPERAVGQLKLAVDEVCTNLVSYGYPEGRVGDIRIEVEITSEEVRVVVTDWGVPFHPDEAPAPDLTSDWKERRIGGLGWHLVKQITERIEYTPDPKRGNVLVLVKELERAG